MVPEVPYRAPVPEQRIIDTLYRVAGFMSEVTDLNRLLTLIMSESEEVMDSEASACMLYDEPSDELYFEVALGEKADQVKTMRLNRGAGIAWACLEKNQTLLVNDVQTDKRHFSATDEKAHFITRNLVATPMLFRGRIIGVLEVLNKRAGQDYDEQDAKILTIVADQAAMAIENARLVERSIQRERLAAIGAAVSGIAHHLKNIIISIKGPISLIKMAFQMNKFEIIADSLPILDRGSTRMEQSVKEMLDYSKDRHPDLEEGNLGELVEEVTSGCWQRAADLGVELRARTEPLADSWLDKLRLHDAILNMVGNAIEAHVPDTPDAWVEVRLRATPKGNRHIVEVADNGPGIPPDIQKKIFQPFFSTKGSKGTGLGLAVAQKVMEENGGSLSLESELGKGTTFTFILPVVRQAPRLASSPEDPR
ncbi:GAF domain-containing sensor histidine kinase [bacterium]|nr:GAF domain-containing sensor histidine kinase [bacterium]